MTTKLGIQPLFALSPFGSSYLHSSHTVSLCHLILHGCCQRLSSMVLSFCCKSCINILGGVQHLLWQQVCLAMAEYLSCNTISSALYNTHRMQNSSHNDSFMMTLYLSCIASIYQISYLGEQWRTIVPMTLSPQSKVKLSIGFSTRLNTCINRLVLPSCSSPLDRIDTRTRTVAGLTQIGLSPMITISFPTSSMACLQITAVLAGCSGNKHVLIMQKSASATY